MLIGHIYCTHCSTNDNKMITGGNLWCDCDITDHLPNFVFLEDNINKSFEFFDYATISYIRLYTRKILKDL